jgi:amino acid transporter
LPEAKIAEPAAAGAPAASGQLVRKVTLCQLVAATFLMVAGGPYGLEDVIKNAGYFMAVLVLFLTPFIWSLPTALMVSEFSSAIPEEGGYYAWVRRAMGPFWGFQEAWLSLAASVFDMAIYPILFATYLDHVCRLVGLQGPPNLAVSMGVIGVCVLVNLWGARAVGGSSILMTFALLGPFVGLTVVSLSGRWTAPARPPQPVELDYLAAVLFAMWNYMGWDNASTIAGEVERPQRTYPLAMAVAVLLVTLTYVIPVAAASGSGVLPGDWHTGSWVEVGNRLGGNALAIAVGVGGMFMGLGMFNALILSYSRIPAVLARDRYLPAVFARRSRRSGAPWVSILACAATWTIALQINLNRVLALDVILYGISLLLEFIALLALRFREPGLARPFRVPGGKWVVGLLGVGPAALIALAIVHERDQTIEPINFLIMETEPINALVLGGALVALGPLVYLVSKRLSRTFSREPQTSASRTRAPEARA